MSENYIVYMHTSPSDKRYIGITSNKPEKRWQNGLGYKNQDYFYNAIKKYGWDNFKHEILYVGLTKEEAEQKEIELITHYKSDIRNYGYNIDHGGNCIGTISEEHKEKIRLSRIGKKHTSQAKEKMSMSKKITMSVPEKNPMYGKHHSTEVKEKISKSKKGKHLSKETKKKIGESNKGKRIIPVSKYTMNGEYICDYASINDAAKDVGVKKDGIIACCKNRYKSSGGYIWRYFNDELTKEHIAWCNSHGLTKAVLQYDINQNFIKEYNSIQEASIKTNVSYSGISACCNGLQKTSGGYIWKYRNDVIEVV